MISTTLAYGYEADKGCGLIVTVKEVGSNHTEQIFFGLAPTVFSWGRIFDPFSRVHIYLQEETDFEFRPIGSDSTFKANIWWTGEAGQLELQFEHLYGGNGDFDWRLPDSPAQVTFLTPETTSYYTIPLSTEPFNIYGQGGPSQLTVNLDYGQAVPEPGGVLAILVGIMGLLAKRNRFF